MYKNRCQSCWGEFESDDLYMCPIEIPIIGKPELFLLCDECRMVVERGIDKELAELDTRELIENG